MSHCDRCDKDFPDGVVEWHGHVRWCTECRHAIAVGYAYEDNVHAADIRDWRDKIDQLGAGSGLSDQLIGLGLTRVIIDAECDVVAIVPQEHAATIAEILNRAAKAAREF